MVKRDDEFLARLLSMFRVEAEERLRMMSTGLLELEKGVSGKQLKEVVETIFREAHSLKGAARSVNMMDIETICQSLESIFALLKQESLRLSPSLFDVLHHAVDKMGQLLSDSDEQYNDISYLLKQLSSAEKDMTESKERSENSYFASEECTIAPYQEELNQEKEESDQRREPVENESGTTGETLYDERKSERTTLGETVRIPTGKLEAIYLQAEEMLAVKQTAAQQVTDLREVVTVIKEWRRDWTKFSPAVRAAQKLMAGKIKSNDQGQMDSLFTRLLEFLDRDQDYFYSMENKINNLLKSSQHNDRLMTGNVNLLLSDIKKTLMLPSSTFFDTIPMMVRDLSKKLEKEVDVVLEGCEVEIDKQILEELRDPIIHILRNCLDHGIEKPEERQKVGKARRGLLKISLSQVGNKVQIDILDDGKGIDLEKVKEAAIKHGVISEENRKKLEESESLALIFVSEVSTNSIITDISGRGLGLAIARKKIEKLGGTISVSSKLLTGTKFRVILPVKMTTFRGIFVKAAERVFVVPASNVEKVIRINKDQIKTIENKKTISLNGTVVSLVRLQEVLELPSQDRARKDSEYIQVLVLSTSENRIAFSVDEIVSEQEILVKKLGQQLQRVRNISGATVLGSGKVVPVLNVYDLMKSAVKNPSCSTVMPDTDNRTTVKGKSILVVEDSITSRMLLKNILESAGYRVDTAVDGMEGLTTLRTGEYDLVVSDVEMPRMNGFDLTEKIRADEMLAYLPVILVTSLDSREDRERGIEVGASAYIVKSSFDHSNLLEVIQRLV